tara:strand:+ start:1301 stop:2065 length:765 start_codon:yes stop_codon:yes gene_type:complete
MVVQTLASKAAQAAAKLLKKPSVMVDDTAKFAGEFGKKNAVKHLGAERVKKAEKAIAKRGEKKKNKKKKPPSKKKFSKKDLKNMSKEERKEFSKLRKQQAADERGTASGGSSSGGSRIETLMRPGRVTQRTPGKPAKLLKRSKRIAVEDPRGALKSKSKMFSDEDMKNLEPHELREEQMRPMPTGTAAQTFDMMRGKGMSKSQMDEIEDMLKSGAISLDRKHGGKVKKYNRGGKVGSPRGAGKALRGWGKVSNS